MKEVIEKSSSVRLSRKSREKISRILLVSGLIVLAIVALFATQVVSAATSEAYLVQEYTSGQEVTITVTSNLPYYDNQSATVEVFASGVPVPFISGQTQANFTGNTQVSFYVSSAFSVYIKVGSSIVYSGEFSAPGTVKEGVSYLMLVEVAGLGIGAFIAGWTIKGIFNKPVKPLGGQYDKADMDGETLKALRIGEILPELTQEQMAGFTEDEWNKVRGYILSLHEAWMAAVGFSPDEFMENVKGRVNRTIDVDLDSPPKGAEAS